MLYTYAVIKISHGHRHAVMYAWYLILKCIKYNKFLPTKPCDNGISNDY